MLAPACASAGYSKKLKIEESQQMLAIEGSPGPKAAYRGGGIILTPAILLMGMLKWQAIGDLEA